jgi:outer membrane lipoprotein-sorting protein
MKLKGITTIALFLVSMLLCTATAQNAQTILANTIANYQRSNSASANYSVLSSQGRSSGSIIMKGNKFRIISNGLKCWYNGKTQWSYSPATGEVNVSTPTADELAMSNPYSVANSLRTNYNATLVSSGSMYVLKLTPKRKTNISNILVSITNGYQIQRAVFTMRDKSKYTTTISSYRAGGKYADGTFNYNSKLVPRGTQVVDLR